jgi:peptide-methionine (S)-S-oxide reductase
MDMDTETVLLGGGCFWCTEAVFTMLKGVSEVAPGYMGGTTQRPTYEQVCNGDTGHVEVIKIEYDPNLLAYEEILNIFFTSHDPTTLNRQGNDVGTQYRSVIFYTTDRQKEKAEHYIKVLASAYSKPIVTTVEPAVQFWPAEDYHKKYYEAHKDAPYCELIIAPKVDKIAEKFPHLLK